jgi:hypothetical protein
LQIAISNFIKEAPNNQNQENRSNPKVQFTIDKSVMTTKEYRVILAQLQALAGIDNEEMIEVTVIKTNPAQ